MHAALSVLRGPVLWSCALALLAACGGGGGDGIGGSDLQCTSSLSGTVTVSGRITYARVPHKDNGGLDYANPFDEPARAISVQAISGGDLLDSDVTDSNGEYSLSVPAGSRLFIRARAEMIRTGTPRWNFRVFDNTSSGNPLYVLDGSAFCADAATLTRNLHADDGFTSSGSPNGPRAAAPFAILDSVYRAYTKVLGVNASAVFPALEIGWSPDNVPMDGGGSGVCASNGNIGTSFYSDSTLCLLGADDLDTDEYDDHVLIHEWAHYFEDQFSRSDTIGGPHGIEDRLDLRVAFSEGFGNAWSGIVTDDPLYRDSLGTNQSQSSDFDVDTDAVTNPGWYNEAAIHQLLYDLYDTGPGGDDALALGLGPIYQVLVGPQRTGVPLTSVFSFLASLKALTPGSAASINALAAGLGINGTDAYGSGETNAAGNGDVLPVYTALTVNGAAVTRCSTDFFGTYNALSNRQFFRFSASGSGVHTIRASISNTGGLAADPVIVLHQAGFSSVERDEGFPGASEVFPVDLSLGDYVIEVWDYRNVTSGGGPAGRYCMDVSVSR